ncbi:HAD family hydrolase [Acetobacter sp. DsW_059]|uniref:HAD family hydrolase n=1 Tax=Acetobacter sp. DsW_059 TaxID=1670661 RepID=UPI000A36D78A|nr:HAD family hydrolase [Acetobacter sp. DsW_059]OUJ08868.1 glycerol-3-phosphatase [Acetobacter sp. DsW_059]
MSDNFTFQADGFFFDMDGTILTSIQASERIWSKWAKRYNLDAMDFLMRSHGRPVTEIIADLNIPNVDPLKEASIITAMEMEDLEGVNPIIGASTMLASLPPLRWAIVTSAPRRLALRRLKAAGLPIPNVLVTCDDVKNGKPNPECYCLAAKKMGLDITKCIVFEDAPSGIQAAENSGARVIVVTDAHSEKQNTKHTSIPNYEFTDFIIS